MKSNSLLKITKNIITKHPILIVIMFICIVLSVSLSVVPGLMIKSIIDQVNEPTSILLKLTLMYLIMLLAIAIVDSLKESIFNIFGQKVITTIRVNMLEKIQHLPYSYYSNNDSGITTSYFTNDVDVVSNLFSNGLFSIVIDGFKIITILITIATFSTTLSLIVLATLPFVFILTRIFQKQMLKAQMKNRVAISDLNNVLAETSSNIEMIQHYNIEENMQDKYASKIKFSFNTIEKINFFDSIYSPIIIVLKSIIIVIIVLGVSQNIFIGLSIGMVAASIELISNLFGPIESIGMELQTIQQSLAGIKRVEEFLNKEEENKSCIIKDLTQTLSQDIDIEFKGLSFGYSSNNMIINNFNLSIKNNPTITFVGRTGAGKSTTFKLIMGLLKPSLGSLTINGINAYDIPNNYKRKLFGIVEQNIVLLDGTIKDQITMFDDSIEDSRVTETLEFVGLLNYVNQFENGINQKITPSMFSQGQRQLLSIARSIVFDPKILLLDEMTSNLDSETENNIINVLTKASKQRTLLSISHRYSSLFENNQIVKL